MDLLAIIFRWQLKHNYNYTGLCAAVVPIITCKWKGLITADDLFSWNTGVTLICSYQELQLKQTLYKRPLLDRVGLLLLQHSKCKHFPKAIKLELYTSRTDSEICLIVAERYTFQTIKEFLIRSVHVPTVCFTKHSIHVLHLLNKPFLQCMCSCHLWRGKDTLHFHTEFSLRNWTPFESAVSCGCS